MVIFYMQPCGREQGEGGRGEKVVSNHMHGFIEKKNETLVQKCIIVPSVFNKGIRGHGFADLRERLLC